MVVHLGLKRLNLKVALTKHIISSYPYDKIKDKEEKKEEDEGDLSLRRDG